MDRPVLCDAAQFPTQDVVDGFLGGAKPLWDELFSFMRRVYPEFSEEWRYYNDGKSWLLKITRKAKTVSWVSIAEGTFRMTFYFPGRALPAVTESALPQELKTQFSDSTARTRGITVLFRDRADLESAKTLFALKESFR